MKLALNIVGFSLTTVAWIGGALAVAAARAHDPIWIEHYQLIGMTCVLSGLIGISILWKTDQKTKTVN